MSGNKWINRAIRETFVSAAKLTPTLVCFLHTMHCGCLVLSVASPGRKSHTAKQL